MKFYIIEKKNKSLLQSFYNIPGILVIIITFLAIMNRLVLNNFFHPLIFLILGFTFFFVHIIKEQFFLPMLFVTRGYINFSNYLEISVDNKVLTINFDEINEISIEYYSYRHWISTPYVLRREDGAKNLLRISFNSFTYNYNFLSENYNDEKRLKSLCYSLHRKGIPIQFYIRGNQIVKSKSKVNF